MPSSPRRSSSRFSRAPDLDCAFVSFLQIDRDGNVNVSKLTKRPYLTAGVGGFIDITARGRRLVFGGTFTTAGWTWRSPTGAWRSGGGQDPKLVPAVEQVTFSGRRGREQHQEVTVVTERCVLKQTEAGLTVTEIAPGVDLERDVLGQAGFPLHVSPDLVEMDPRLFRPEPVGLELEARPQALERVMSEPRILVRRDGSILTLTLNRPDKLNAIDGAMLDALGEALGEIERDREIRAVILTGAGRAFSAGADIKEWTALAPLEFARSWGLRGHALFDRLAALPPPVIAAINGIAFGGGLELALCADIRIASEQARLGLPEVTIAALPGWGGTQRLPRLIGPGRAKHMVLTGQPIDAARAEAWGLVSEVVAADALPARARSWPRRSPPMRRSRCRRASACSMPPCPSRPGRRWRPRPGRCAARPRTPGRGAHRSSSAGRRATRAAEGAVMPLILLTHADEARAHYYGAEPLARLQELGEVRLNESGHPLSTPQLIELARGCQVIVSDRTTEGPAARSSSSCSDWSRSCAAPSTSATSTSAPPRRMASW